MNKYKVTFSGERTFFASDYATARKQAEADLMVIPAVFRMEVKEIEEEKNE